MKALACFSQLHTAGFAHQQGHTVVFFKLAQRFGQGGLGQMQGPRGRPDAAVVNHAHQSLKLVKFHSG
jgi:hypothetical protein